jgi:TfoX/Sxy family transcriptional regulator of competence genes
MASNQTTVDYIVEQMAGAGAISAKKMFGEFGIYCGGKIVALVCDNQLFVKITEGGKRTAGKVSEAPPYKGAKPSLLIPPDLWDDADWLAQLIRTTAAELPVSKKKASRKA